MLNNKIKNRTWESASNELSNLFFLTSQFENAFCTVREK